MTPPSPIPPARPESAQPQSTTAAGDAPAPPRRPWPLSWIFIAILGYIAFQTAYFLFFAR